MARSKENPAGVDGRCNAKRRQGGLCRRPAGWGTPHPGKGRCKNHGGSTRLHLRAAAKDEARELAATYGENREVDPFTALEEELWRTAGHVSWLQAEIARLQTSDVYGPVGDSLHPEQKRHAYIAIYQDEREHFAKIAKTCIDAGLDVRRVQLAEQQGQLIAKVIQGVLVDLGVALDAPATRQVVREHLMAIESTATEVKPTEESS